MRQLRIAVAGAGLIGRRHIDVVNNSAEAVLCAVVDPAPAAAELAGAAQVRWHFSIRDMLDAGPPDAVILATPNHLHVSDGLACIEAGVPVLVEKPIAGSVEDAVRLVEAAERAGVPLMVGHHRRHSPLLAAARRLIAEGALGQLVAVQGSALFYKPDDYFDAAPWRREHGGGPILINMIHEVDNLRALCGEIESVQALASNSTRGFPVEDTVAITLRFATGVLGSFLLSDTAASARSWEHTSRENGSYPTYPEEDAYIIAGTKGSLSVPTMRLKTYPGPASWWEPFETSTADVVRTDPLVNQLTNLLAVVRGGAEPLVSGRDGLQSLRVTDAITAAAKTGRTVRVTTS